MEKDIKKPKRKLSTRANLLVKHFKRPFYDEMIRNIISHEYNFEEDPMFLAEIDPDPVNHKTAGWRRYKHTDVRIIKATSHEAIVIPKVENPDPTCRVAVLNFASAINPGGLFLVGSAAQEDMLCHHSLLYPVLAAQKGHYEYNKKNSKNELFPHTMIYSERVPFYDIAIIQDDEGKVVEFRTKDLLQHAMSRTFIRLHRGTADADNMVPVDARYLVEDISSDADVITCAAPNFRGYSRYVSDMVSRGNDEMIRKAWFDIFDTMRMRIHYVFRAALAHGVSDLILGAWGCGVDGWDPVYVASLFRYEIEKYWLCQFRSILFAMPAITRTYDTSVVNQNTFNAIFSIVTDEIDFDGGPLQYWHAFYGKDRNITEYFQQYMDELIQNDLSKRMETAIHNEAHSDTVEQ